MQSMFHRTTSTLAIAVTALWAGQALAANPQAILTINQYDASGSTVTHSWQENLAPLLSVNDVTGDFTLIQGSTGQKVYNLSNPSDPDYWAWNSATATAAGYWSWHSAQTLDGSTPEATNSSNPWMTSISLTTLSGHGDPDMSYGFTARNNTNLTQTYTFSVSEVLTPAFTGANTVYADVGAALSNPSGSLQLSPVFPATTIQTFSLSSDFGATLVNAGVNVGPAYTTATTGTSFYPLSTATASGPVGTWNYMQIDTQFTLSGGRDVASVSGFASITAVPEPDDFALMASGLLMMGFIATRRNSKV